MTNIDQWQTDAPTITERPSWMTNEIEELLKLRNFPLDQSGMLMLHQHTKAQLDNYKEMEMEFRKVCAAFLVPDAIKNEGMNNIELGNGYVAKVGIKMNYKLASDNDIVWKGLEAIEKLGNEGKFVSERLVSWSPNFLLTEYRQLQEDAEKGSQFAKDALKAIEGFLVISEAAPTLEIKEPKTKGKK